MKISKLISYLEHNSAAAMIRILFVTTFIVYSGVCLAEDVKSENAAPLHVTSDKMIAMKETSMVEFVGNVRATRLESILLADSIKVYFNETSDTESSEPQSNIKKIVAAGTVQYTEGDRKAFADQAVYTTADEVLILTGKSPKLQTGTSFVTGKKITLFRIEDRVLVESDSTRRVEALFNPEDNVKKDQ